MCFDWSQYVNFTFPLLDVKRFWDRDNIDIHFTHVSVLLQFTSCFQIFKDSNDGSSAGRSRPRVESSLRQPLASFIHLIILISTRCCQTLCRHYLPRQRITSYLNPLPLRKVYIKASAFLELWKQICCRTVTNRKVKNKQYKSISVSMVTNTYKVVCNTGTVE